MGQKVDWGGWTHHACQVLLLGNVSFHILKRALEPLCNVLLQKYSQCLVNSEVRVGQLTKRFPLVKMVESSTPTQFLDPHQN